MTESFDRAAIKALIGQARNPLRHGDESDHCSVCFGSCGAWPGDRVGDEEELIAELADTALALLTALDEAERRIAEVERLAKLDLKCPCCTGYGRIIAALHPVAETTEKGGE